jgi:HK97 family phage portal protein
VSWSTSLFGWLGFGSASLAEREGVQRPVPSVALVPDTTIVGADGALQISAVWSCIDRRATTIASLPFFAYERDSDGQKQLAPDSRLYAILHESPNPRMTPFEFWRAMVMNHDLRGNAYARIDRDPRTGEAIALWPMPADQVCVEVLPDGAMVYEYTVGSNVAVLAEANVLHLKNLGNGTMGLAKLEFMRGTTDELSKAQTSASKVFGNGGKPTGVLMVDKVLTADQRKTIRERFAEMASGNMSRLFVLEASMKYQQLSMTPEDQQLLETRKFGIEEICRWFDVPPVLAHHSNVTTWGSGIEQLVDGFYKLTIRPMLVGIEQAVRKRVMTPSQRARQTCEFALEALLRGSLKDRAAIYSQLGQNGAMTRNEMRQLENLPRDPSPMADMLTVQSNLVPLPLLGAAPPTSGANANASAENPPAE